MTRKWGIHKNVIEISPLLRVVIKKKKAGGMLYYTTEVLTNMMHSTFLQNKSFSSYLSEVIIKIIFKRK